MKQSGTRRGSANAGTDHSNSAGGVASYYPTLYLQPGNNYVTWVVQFLQISRIKFGDSAVRFSQSHNECVFARMPYVHTYTPLDAEEWDNQEGDEREALSDEEIQEINAQIDWDNPIVNRD